MENPKDHQYWTGPKNRIIRYWFYVNRGMDWLNQFRNLFLLIFAAYFTLKLHNPVWLIIMLVPSIIFLGIAGYVQVHYIGRVLDWLNVRFSTHYSIASFEMQKEIRDGIQTLVKNSMQNPK